MTTETTSGRTERLLVIAHRGASAAAPENTIAAFELAIADGADGIELDVHLSSDDQPVVIHDVTRRANHRRLRVGQGRTLRELKRLDAGGWHGPRFQGQRIQTLQEVFERFRDRTRFWIELKGRLRPLPRHRGARGVDDRDLRRAGPDARPVLRSESARSDLGPERRDTAWHSDRYAAAPAAHRITRPTPGSLSQR